jgi:sulfotransferase
MKKLFFLAGLPRTGSTLLTAILSQNPNVLSEGTSGLIELMWKNQQLFWENEGIISSIHYTDKKNVEKNVIQQLPQLYYKDSKQKYIIDKNRNWTHFGNIKLLTNYVTKNPKIIVMLRPIPEIVESFYYIFKKNSELKLLENTLYVKNNPLMLPFEGLLDALHNNKEHLLLLTYNELVHNPKNVVDKIYKFLDIPTFEHDFNHIVNQYPEGDYNINGLHEVRSTIGLRNKKVKLPKQWKQKAMEMQQQLEETLEAVGEYDIFKK